MSSGWAPAWGRSRLSPLLWAIGLGILSLVLLVSVFLPSLSVYAFGSLLFSLIGLAISILGLYTWVAARGVRSSVVTGRLEGKAIWPIYALTASKRYVGGVLEVSEDGLEVRLRNGVAPLDWKDLTVIDATKPGPIRGGRLILEGSKFGHAELKLLEANAVTPISEEALQEFVALVKNLSSNGAPATG